MSSHLARRGGIWWVRLAVPARLRPAAGRREFTQSCRTHDLAIAKLVASALLVGWRRQLFNLDSCPMPLDILKLIAGSPALAIVGWIPIVEAATHSGISQTHLLRRIADGTLRMSCRQSQIRGRIVPLRDLELENSEAGPAGGVVIPPLRFMPESAVEKVFGGNLLIEIEEGKALAHAILAQGLKSIDLLSFEVEGNGESIFIPDSVVTVSVETLEVQTSAIESLRRTFASSVTPEQKAAASLSSAAKPHAGAGKKADRPYSEAVTAFAKEVLAQKMKSASEVERQRKELMLLADFMGDLKLGEIDADVLRVFRDTHLATLPGRLNHAEAKFNTVGAIATIEAIKGSGDKWPCLSAEQRDKRMTRICRMFAWLQPEWLNDNPSASLKGVSVQSKAERTLKEKTKETRVPFTQEELSKVFSQSWFATGKIRDVEGVNRKCRPFEYWLPLMALHAGERIGELCQLHLDDVCKTEAGTWYLNIHEISKDKSLKTDASTRMVPLHPILIQSGFIKWCERLRKEGFQRVFPELSWSETTRYAKEPKRAMSDMFKKLGMPRNNTKVFHSFRHNVNNALIRLSDKGEVPERIRLRVLGHAAGEGVNVEHYFNDYDADETSPFVAKLSFNLPKIAEFNFDEGVESIRDALDRKLGHRRNKEDMGPKA